MASRTHEQKNERTVNRPPKCDRCGAPAYNVRSNNEYTGEHRDLEECLRTSTTKHRMLAEQVADLSWQVSRLAEQLSRHVPDASEMVREIETRCEELADEVEAHYVP